MEYSQKLSGDCSPLFSYLFSSKILFAFILFTNQAYAKTPANTLIQNVATVQFTMGGSNFQTLSPVHSFKVEELIDVSVVSNTPAGVQSLSPSSNAVLSFTLTNNGNGSEQFQVVASNVAIGDQFDANNISIYLDANANGVYDSGTDTLHVLGVNDPTLNPDANLTLFLVADIPAALTDGDFSLLDLSASSVTGTGAPGDSFPGQGTGGVIAMVGFSGGTSTSQSRYTVASSTASVIKTHSIDDQQGGSTAIPNAIITYTLTVNVSGTGLYTYSNLLVTDAIPAGTTYVLGSMALNGTSLTDAPMDDAGIFNGAGIEVTLPDMGSLPAPTTQVVTFEVRIQ